MKIVYMGTPDFAVGPLESIIEAGHEVILVVTQPDREKGRGKEVVFSPVKECAVAHNIPVFQPEKIKKAEEVEFLKQYEADVFVVAAFGQILSKEILDMPRLGCVNIHASLLPKYRGAAPIQWAVIDGEEKTGVTIMRMDEGLDTGDILLQEEIILDAKETGESLFDRLAVLGSDTIVKALELMEKGELTPVPQDHDKSTYAKMLNKKMGVIDFNNSAVVIERLVRGLNSWPSAYTYINGKTIKIWEAEVIADALEGQNGQVVKVSKDSFFVKCAEGMLEIMSLQLEGKKRMNAGEFMRGYDIHEGMILGE